MTLMRMIFAGHAKKVESKMAGDKPILEVSLCKKVSKAGVEPAVFTWIRVTIWQPPDWMTQRLVKGSFVAGSGEFTSRSFDGKDGKQTALEVRSTSFDIEVGDAAPSDAVAAQQQRPAPVKPAPSGGGQGSDSPPFAPDNSHNF